MVRFETTRFGMLELEEDRIIDFPEGLLGFPNLKRYILMDYEDTPVKWLQAVDDPDIAFIVMPSEILSPDFSVKKDAVITQLLQLESDDDITILLVVRVEGNKVIANLKGPLLLNSRNMRGMQYVVNEAT